MDYTFEITWVNLKGLLDQSISSDDVEHIFDKCAQNSTDRPLDSARKEIEPFTIRIDVIYANGTESPSTREIVVFNQNTPMREVLQSNGLNGYRDLTLAVGGAAMDPDGSVLDNAIDEGAKLVCTYGPLPLRDTIDACRELALSVDDAVVYAKRQPRNAFMYYEQVWEKQLKNSYITEKDIDIKRKWKAMNDEEKAPYVEGFTNEKTYNDAKAEELQKEIEKVRTWVRLNGDGTEDWVLQVLQLRMDVTLGRAYKYYPNRTIHPSVVDILPPGTKRLSWDRDEMGAMHWRIKDDLNFINNRLTSLPESFGGVHVTGNLTIRWNDELNVLPETFGGVYVEKTLSLDENHLVSLPDSFGGLHVGGDMWLEYNQLTSLPESFDQVRIGDSLNLGGNQLVSLPDSFGGLRVNHLFLGDNQLVGLPDSIGDLQMDGDLEIYNNHLTSLPDSFAGVRVGGALDLAFNPLVSLPDSFDNVHGKISSNVGDDEYKPL